MKICASINKLQSWSFPSDADLINPLLDCSSGREWIQGSAHIPSGKEENTIGLHTAFPLSRKATLEERKAYMG